MMEEQGSGRGGPGLAEVTANEGAGNFRIAALCKTTRSDPGLIRWAGPSPLGRTAPRPPTFWQVADFGPQEKQSALCASAAITWAIN